MELKESKKEIISSAKELIKGIKKCRNNKEISYELVDFSRALSYAIWVSAFFAGKEENGKN